MNDIKKTFKPTGYFKENRKFFYTVNHDGKEYSVPMFKYQIPLGLPDALDCIIKKDKGGIHITQDLQKVIKERYEVGGVYNFKIKERQGDNYTVLDENGLVFYLTEYKGRTLPFGKSITAKVKSIRKSRVVLTFVGEKKADNDVPFFSLDMLGERLNVSIDEMRALRDVLVGTGYLDEAKSMYLAKDGKWLLEALLKLDELLRCDEDIKIDIKQYINIIQQLCLLVIEESDILKKLTPEERKDWITKISIIAQYAEDYQKAYEIHGKGEAKEYISKQLDNLEKSEYLYQPERKFRIIMCLLNLDSTIMPEMVDRLFDIILHGNKDSWRNEPFRTAIVDMLEMFISEYRYKAIRTRGVELIHQLIRAIAIQQMLSNGDDDVDRRLNRATYYRLLAYAQRYASTEILNDSFRSLFEQYQPKVEYKWEDIESLDSLYMRSAYKDRSIIECVQKQRFVGGNVELIVNGQGVIIQPTTGYPSPQAVSNVLDWQQLEINTNSTKKAKCKDATKVDAVVKFWKEVENELWAEHKMVKDPQLSTGEQVKVRVIDQTEKGDALLCEIVSNRYKGTGWLDIKNTISYIQPSEDIINLFHDGNGNPILFEATVIGEKDEDGEYEFSIEGQIIDHIDDSLEYGSEMVCSIRTTWKDRDTDTQYHVGVASNGFPCLIPFADGVEIKKGEYVKVIATDVKSTGQVICEFVDRSFDNFNIGKAFNSLMYAISVEEDDDEEVIDDTMELSSMREIVGILDRQSVISESRALSYSYVALAGIISRIIDDKPNINYYNTRKRIIVATDEYERNGYVDDQKLSELLDSIGGDLMNTDYQINDAVTKFRILQCLKHKDRVPELMRYSQNATNSSIKNAADLAIAMLLTNRFELPNVERLLLDRINKEIGVRVKASKLRDFGIETQTQEFKSSMVFPPDNNMRAEKLVQGANIMRVICSFLNSDDGGTLYFGVSKTGASCGVEQDLKCLNTDEDGYGRYIHNYINKELGTIANQCCIDCHWEEDAGYKIYVMNIAPAPELIKYKGEYWIRQDTEKRILPPADVEAFAKMHEAAYERYMASRPAKEAEPQPAPAAEDKDKKEKSNLPSVNIATSHHRINVINDWEDGYGVDTAAFLHFMSNWKYKVTDDGIYEGTELSLAVAQSEADGYLMVGYESGKMLIVDMKDVLGKTRNRQNARCQSENAIFACPAHKGDGVLSVWRNTLGELMARIDVYDNLVNEHCNGGMTDNGAMVHDTKYKEVVAYEIVPEEIMPKLQKFCNQGSGLGQKLKDKERLTLNQLLHLDL